MPREASREPSGRGDDRHLAPCVVDGLAFVVLAVELDEEPDLGPRQIHPSDEVSVLVDDLVLASWPREAVDCSGELHHERFQQAFGGWSVATGIQYASNATHTRRP